MEMTDFADHDRKSIQNEKHKNALVSDRSINGQFKSAVL
jgi:hypothetical protein